MFGSTSNPVLRVSRDRNGAGATQRHLSNGGGCSEVWKSAPPGLTTASPFSNRGGSTVEEGRGRRRRVLGRGQRQGSGGLRAGEGGGGVGALQAYRYLNTYYDGISDEDREWNKFEEKDYVELGTSGLMVSRVSVACVHIGVLQRLRHLVSPGLSVDPASLSAAW